MDQEVAIKVERLGKKYRISQKKRTYGTLRESLTNGFSHTFGAFNRNAAAPKKTKDSEFWALKDISFEVKRGEVIGIIGRNGAGKSTLLKTLARITEPTAGTIDIYGRVGSLLEVGTGFHPELSGRENIFLSGSILGMKKQEIARQFDQIVEFAEVEKFIETPVKHYSSGMYLRLAFGVAAHLQPEILLVDEVLAVGDAVFQKKCLGKMDDVAKQGRTVLFVSHNMSAVQDLCQRGILIEEGQLTFDGSITDCIGAYYRNINNLNSGDSHQLNPKDKRLQVSALKINNSLTPTIQTGQKFEVSLNLSGGGIGNSSIFFIVESVSGQQIIHDRVSSKDLGLEAVDEVYQIKISVPGLWLSPGMYSIYFKFLVPSIEWSGRINSERLLLEVQGDFDNTGKTTLSPPLNWQISSANQEQAEHSASPVI